MYKTFFSYSFGCRVNQAEKEMLDSNLIKLGYSYNPIKPNIFIINTCAVTAKAEREARQLIYQTRRKYPKTKIIVTGCAATRWIRDKINVKGVDLLVDNAIKNNLPNIIFNFQFSIFNQIPMINFSKNLNDKFLNSKRMFIKIQDGCQRFCTYCIVPYLRGKPKSVQIKDIVNQIKTVENNITEIVLAAINTEAFGLDTGEKLTDLIQEILDKTKIKRLCFGSIHPWSINQEFLNFYRQILTSNWKKRFIHFFHIPIQSGSDKMLKLMKRDYTTSEIIEKITAIKKINPFAFIGTDIITGFLDETDKDFEDTYNFLKKAPIDRFHIFRFSNRDNTAAWFMKKRMMEPTSAIKEKRAKTLIELGQRKYLAFLKKHIGKSFQTLILEKKIKDYHEALLENQVPVFVKIEDKYIGRIINIKVTGLINRQLYAVYKYT
jgi:threonylcarbamoyladenosine tRNA methylthiotransferase MtaB